jgi:hypothetical protein
MVQLHPGPPCLFEWVADDMVESLCGGVAQLGERLPCTQEVIGSIPFTSTTFKRWMPSLETGYLGLDAGKNASLRLNGSLTIWV